MAKPLNKWTKDVVWAEAYSELNAQEMAVVNSIAESIDKKVDRRVAAMPFYYYVIPIAIVAGILLSGTLIINYFISETSVEAKTHLVLQHQNNSVDQSLTKKEHLPSNVEEVSIANEETHSNTSNTDINPFHKANSTEVITTNDDKKGDLKVPNTTIDNKEPNKTTSNDLKTDVTTTDNSRNFVDESNKIITLRVGSAAILSKTCLADIDNSSNTSTSPNNPNIGSKVITKSKNNAYALDDLPHYKNGDAGFTSYLNRSLNYAISIMKKDAVYSTNVRFEVNAKGKVEHVEIIGNIPSSMEREITNVIKNAPDWIPGKKSGKKGSIEVMVNIQFY